MTAVGILLAAGSSNRMGFNKLTTPLAGETAVLRSANALIAGGCEKLMITYGESTREYLSRQTFAVPFMLTPGGETRQASVKNALHAAIEAFELHEGDVAVIHDAARCFVRPEVVSACIASAREYGSGVAATKLVNTVMEREGEGVLPLPRENLLLMQTPQAFRFSEILPCYDEIAEAATDDCSLYARSGRTPRFVEGGADNVKLTSAADWKAAKARLSPPARFGTGFDTHVLVTGRRLVLGGVTVPYDKGLDGHSDADVVIHAVIDALLGAAALGDIGRLFPDSDAAYQGIDSRLLLSRTAEVLRQAGFSIVNVDATVIAQKPKLAPHIPLMRERIAESLGLPVSLVSVKATTTEKMNDEGRGLCISCMAAASVR